MNGGNFEALYGLSFIASCAAMILSSYVLYRRLRDDDPTLSPVFGHSGPAIAILYLKSRGMVRTPQKTTLAVTSIAFSIVFFAPFALMLVRERTGG